VHGRSELDKWTGKDVGEHEIEWRGRAQVGMAEALGLNDTYASGDAVQARVGACYCDGNGIAIAGQYARLGIKPRRSDGQHARATTKVENAGATKSMPRYAIERLQAAGSGRAMASAKGLASFDLDAVAAQREAGTIMAPLHDEPASGDRRQRSLRDRKPVCVRHCFHLRRPEIDT
jgi:hypothetical protein